MINPNKCYNPLFAFNQFGDCRGTDDFSAHDIQMQEQAGRLGPAL